MSIKNCNDENNSMSEIQNYFTVMANIIASWVICPPFIDVISIGEMAKQMDITNYKSRKYMKELEKLGFVVRQSVKLSTDYDECDCFPPINGWGLTELGMETEEYRNAKNLATLSLKQCFMVD